jgi:hypothetical protein
MGEPRQTAVAQAAAAAEIVIVDGLLQARPRPLALSLLALDGAAPWARFDAPGWRPSGSSATRPGCV